MAIGHAKRPGARRRYDDQTRQKARELYDAGVSLHRISEALGISFETARKWVDDPVYSDEEIEYMRRNMKVAVKECYIRGWYID